MNKILIICNKVYIPMTNNKYIGGSISGVLFPSEILTLEEIQEKHKNSSYKLKECDSFNNMKSVYNEKEQA